MGCNPTAELPMWCANGAWSVGWLVNQLVQELSDIKKKRVGKPHTWGMRDAVDRQIKLCFARKEARRLAMKTRYEENREWVKGVNSASVNRKDPGLTKRKRRVY